jgi:hypothetical protein
MNNVTENPKPDDRAPPKPGYLRRTLLNPTGPGHYRNRQDASHGDMLVDLLDIDDGPDIRVSIGMHALASQIDAIGSPWPKVNSATATAPSCMRSSRKRPSTRSDRPFPRVRTCSWQRPNARSSSLWLGGACDAPGRDRRQIASAIALPLAGGHHVRMSA